MFNGRFNTGEWISYGCQTPSVVAALTNTDTLGACGDFQYQVDSLGGLAITNTKHSYLSNSGGTANSGVGLFTTAGNSISFASSTPVMEFALNASNTLPLTNLATATLYAGFFNTNPAVTSFEVIPTAGSFITASGTPNTVDGSINYWAVSKTSNANYQAVNTGIGLVTNQYFVQFRIEYLFNGGVVFLAKTPTSTEWRTVATMPASVVASTTGMSAGVYIGRGAVTGSASSIIINNIKVWLRKTLWL